MSGSRDITLFFEEKNISVLSLTHPPTMHQVLYINQSGSYSTLKAVTFADPRRQGRESQRKRKWDV